MTREAVAHSWGLGYRACDCSRGTSRLEVGESVGLDSLLNEMIRRFFVAEVMKIDGEGYSASSRIASEVEWQKAGVTWPQSPAAVMEGRGRVSLDGAAWAWAFLRRTETRMRDRQPPARRGKVSSREVMTILCLVDQVN